VLAFRLATAALLLVSAGGGAAEWSQWRGPNGTGTAPGAPPTKDDLLWKVPLPDKGNGSPVIVGGKMYLQTAAADGRKRALLCLSAVDGKQVWASAHDAEKGHTHAKGGLAANTPCADGNGVYCVWWDGPTIGLRAYDPATGKERWAAPLGRNTNQHGAHYSPVVHAGTVFVNVDRDDGAEVFAFDAETGKKVWSAERPHVRANYTLPVLFERAGKPTELVVSNSRRIDGYDPKTGKVNWSYTIAWPKETQPLRMIGAPQFTNGLLVAHTGDGSGSRYAFAITPGGTGDLSKTAPAWEARRGTPYIPGIVTRGEHLFWVDDKGIATCAEVKTGKIVWAERVYQNADVSASPLLIGERVLAVSEKGQVAVWKAAKEFDLVAEWTLGEQVIAAPAAANGRVYVRGATHLFCYGKK